jgi:hypothetical protein
MKEKDPSRLSPSEVAELVGKVYPFPVTPAMVKADLAAGAPVNDDGSIHLVRYAAWLAREANRGGQSPEAQAG